METFGVLMPYKDVRVDDAQMVSRSRFEACHFVRAAAFSPDGIFISRVRLTMRHESLKRGLAVWSSRCSMEIQSIRLGSAQMGKSLPACLRDGTARLFVPRSGQELARLALPEGCQRSP